VASPAVNSSQLAPIDRRPSTAFARVATDHFATSTKGTEDIKSYFRALMSRQFNTLGGPVETSLVLSTALAAVTKPLILALLA
jgi:hypothetical protein